MQTTTQDTIQQIVQEKHNIKKVIIKTKRCHWDCTETTEKPESEGVSYELNSNLTIWFYSQDHLDQWKKKYNL